MMQQFSALASLFMIVFLAFAVIQPSESHAAAEITTVTLRIEGMT
jgi:hypothetical protein